VFALAGIPSLCSGRVESFVDAINLGFEPRAVAGGVSSPATACAVDAE